MRQGKNADGSLIGVSAQLQILAGAASIFVSDR
jgi:hypothetical protein